MSQTVTLALLDEQARTLTPLTEPLTATQFQQLVVVLGEYHAGALLVEVGTASIRAVVDRDELVARESSAQPEPPPVVRRIGHLGVIHGGRSRAAPAGDGPSVAADPPVDAGEPTSDG